MTQDQIEDVTLGIAAAMIDPSEDAVELALWRLLEERRRLLEALKRERDHTDGIHDEGLDAIIYAEEPAR